VGWPRLEVRVAMVASAAAVISVVAFAVVAFAVRDGGARPAFNACISQTRSLVLGRHASGNKAIALIRDRAHGAVVGEFALLPSERAAEAFSTTLAGSGAQNGRHVVFTTDPVGRDATAIELCFDRVFPPLAS
jgi:hypothetical protein